MTEKRKYPRIHDDLGIAINVVDNTMPAAHGRRILHMTDNISRGGIQFKHDHALPVDSLIRIHVALKFPLRTITHLARVRWVRPLTLGQRCSVGVEFTETPPVDMIHWAHYIDHKMIQLAPLS